MRILLVTSEYEGLVKVGGLSDFSAAMAAALARQGHEVRVLLPRYARIDPELKLTPVGPLTVPLSFWQSHGGFVWRWQHASVPVYLLEHQQFFGRSGIYDDGLNPYDDNPLRYAYLSHAAFSLCQLLDWYPDVIHASDWPTALVPFYRREHYASDPRFRRCRTVLTIHNGAYQGRFDRHWHEPIGIHPRLLVPELFEDMGCINLLKAGIRLADELVTVSPSYRDELLQPATSHGLAASYQHRRQQLSGIVNGVDAGSWDPASDPAQSQPFGPGRLAGKAGCKAEQQQRHGLPVDDSLPLLAMIGRVASQKGFAQLLPALEALLPGRFQLVVMGHGEPRWQQALTALAARFPQQLVYLPSFSDSGTRALLGAADYLLMPSLFEPCGLSQLYAMRYATIPLVTPVGGLKDTVIPLGPTLDNRDRATGYCANAVSSEALVAMLQRVEREFGDQMLLAQLRRNAMASNFSWDQAASRYRLLYQRACRHHSRSVPLTRRRAA